MRRRCNQDQTAARRGVARRIAQLSLASILVMLTAGAAAQPVPSLDLRGFNPSADPASGLYFEPASSPAFLDWNTALWLSYALRPVTLTDPVDEEAEAFAVVGHQLTGDFILNVGLFERAAIGIDLPFLLYQQGDEPTPQAIATLGDYQLPGQALGDLKLLGKVTIIKPTGEEFGGFALAVHERLALPSGDEASYLGEGTVASETRLLIEYGYAATMWLRGAVGFKARGAEEPYACTSRAAAAAAAGTELDCPTTFGHEIPFGLALSFVPQAIGLGESWSIFAETYGYVPASPQLPFDNAKVSQLQLGGGVRIGFGDLSLLIGAEAALVSGIGNAPFRATVAFGWAPRKHDGDDDGVHDDFDKCPEVKEDPDGYQDDDGCPEWDNDEDGVPDKNDKCEGQLEDEDEHEDFDGCPDPDNDGDGILDVDDSCPDVAGIKSDDKKQHGCPDLDPDRDGIRGDADACPTKAEDPDKFNDEDGCPDPDNDGDGIDDVNDACRDQAGVPFDNDPAQNGCPDRDGDGISDGQDACPDQAGVASPEDAQRHGCPAEADKDKKPGR